MHREFEIIDDKVIIRDDLNHKYIREVTDNVEEILITENNIEEIEEFINYEEEKQKTSKKKIKENYILRIGLGGLQLTCAILNIIDLNILLSVLWSIAALCNTGLGSYEIISEKRDIKVSKKQMEILYNKLNEENERLRELNQKKITNPIFVDTSKRNISTSEKIEKLKHTLQVIRDYEYNKRKYIKLYKKGSLRLLPNSGFKTVGYGTYDIKLIEELIKNDLNDKEFIEDNEKAKQKRIKKN